MNHHDPVKAARNDRALLEVAATLTDLHLERERYFAALVAIACGAADPVAEAERALGV